MTAQSSFFADLGFSKRGKRIPPVEAVCAMARRLWPSKTAINIASRAEVSERAAKLWLEGRTEPGADALVNLLRSDVGFELLQQIMVGSGTRWWNEFETGVHLAELNEKHEFLKQQIDALKGRMK